MTKWKHFKNGVLQELPIQIGVFPFGLIYGVMAIESGLSFYGNLALLYVEWCRSFKGIDSTK